MNRKERNYEDMIERKKQRLLRKGETMAHKEAEDMNVYGLSEEATKYPMEMSDKNLPSYSLIAFKESMRGNKVENQTKA